MLVKGDTKDIEKFNKSIKLKMFIGIVFFRVVIDYIYSEYVSSIFRYDGLIKSFSYEKYFLSWAVLLIFIPLIISLHKRISFSSVILILLGYLSIIPFTTMIAYYPLPLKYIFANTAYWLVLFAFYKVIPKISFIRVKNDGLVNLLINSIIIVFSLTIIYISWRYTGFRITLDIFNVYDLRSEASDFNLPTVLSYIYSATKALNPVLMVYFLHRKKNKVAILILFIQLLSFSINGSKTVLFSTFLAFILYWFYSEKYLYKIPMLLGALGVVSGIEVILANSYLLIAFIIRRVLFIPNLLSFYYFDFFTVNTPDYFRLSFLRHFGFESKYPDIVYMLGNIYFQRPEMAVNNGLIGDAFANLGWIGIIVMPLLIVITLKILDAASEGLDIKIFIMSAVTITFIFISSFYFTILMTHGLIAVCLILYLLPRDYELNRDEIGV